MSVLRKPRPAPPLRIRIRVRKWAYDNHWLGSYRFLGRGYGLWGSGGDNITGTTRDVAVYKATVEALSFARRFALPQHKGQRMPARIEVEVTDEN